MVIGTRRNFKGFIRKKFCIPKVMERKIPEGFKSFKISIIFLHSKWGLSFENLLSPR
jgi:hypothetical protein